MDYSLQLCRKREIVNRRGENDHVRQEDLRIDCLHVILLHADAFSLLPAVFTSHTSFDVLMGNINGNDLSCPASIAPIENALTMSEVAPFV